MSKELPYFKFIATEWLTGDIALESLEVQGLFINICAIYWKKFGELELSEIEKRFKKKALIAKLTDRYISVSEGYISISFLDEQLSERQGLSERNSLNGKKGGKPAHKKSYRTLTENIPTLTDRLPKLTNIEKEKEEEKEKEYITGFVKNAEEFHEDIKKHTQLKIEYPWKEVLEYLNLKANKDFKFIEESKTTITARFKEGFVLEDFKKAIDVKVSQWLNDPEMNMYLRPATLFGKKKFEGYVNEVVKPGQVVGKSNQIGNNSPQSYEELMYGN